MTPGLSRPAIAAPFWRRAFAALLDLLIPVALLAAVGWSGLLPAGDLLPPRVLPLLDHLADLALHRGPLLLRWATLAGGVGATYLVVFYGLVGRTPGEGLTALRLADATGEPPGPLRSLLRLALLLPCLLPCGAGFWWAAADRERRALYDRLSGTWLLVGRAGEPDGERRPG